MPSFTHPMFTSAPVARTVAIAALIGTTFLATPLTAARADSATAAPTQLAQTAPAPTRAAAEATDARSETVEQRITNLHSALQITPAEESKWNSVAQTMRENAAAMQKLAAEKTAQGPQSLTAVDDLKNYRQFAQAHVDGLKRLISSFESLYDAMSDGQKKNADQVFQTFGREGAPPRG